jgi:hypothetical protein
LSKYSDGLGRHIRVNDVSLKASAAETASTTHTALELGDAARVNLALDVTAFGGTTPTLDITIEGSNDGTNWYTLGTFAQKVNVATERKAFLAARHVRSRSVITGSAGQTFTYSITGEAA